MRRYGATLLRLILGALFVVHGYFGPPLLTSAETAAVVNRIGFSGALTGAAWYVFVAQLVGGLLMILGIFTRWAALANVPLLFCALLLIHWKEGFFMKGAQVGGNLVAAGYEFWLLLLVATLAQVFLGGGAFALKDR